VKTAPINTAGEARSIEMGRKIHHRRILKSISSKTSTIACIVGE
jgi:hypothetical protein